MSNGVLTSWASFDPNVGMFGADKCVEIGIVQSVCGCVFQAYAAIYCSLQFFDTTEKGLNAFHQFCLCNQLMSKEAIKGGKLT